MLARFCTIYNPYYIHEGITFNDNNLQELYNFHSFNNNISILSVIQITYIIPDNATTNAHTINSSYTNYINLDLLISFDKILMEIIRFPNSNTSKVCYTFSKACTL